MYLKQFDGGHPEMGLFTHAHPLFFSTSTYYEMEDDGEKKRKDLQ